MLGLDEFYDNLILEAKSTEEIQKILHYQFVQGKNVPESIFYYILGADPTKKKSYTRWMLSHWENEKKLILDLVQKQEVARLFQYFQSRQNNGLNLVNIGSVKEAIEMMPDFDPVLEKNGNGGPEDDYDIVYDTPDWKIAVPHTYEASEKLGQGCRWCTAGAYRNGLSYYNQYTNQGPLWINFDMRKGETSPTNSKEYPYTRYQFCFESGDFRDSDDESINSIEDIEMPDDVLEFYGEQNENYKYKLKDTLISDEERYERYDEERSNHSYLLKEYDGCYLELMPEWSNDYVFDANDNYYLYDTGMDSTDPISYVDININEPISKNYESCSLIELNVAGNDVDKVIAYVEKVNGYNRNWQTLESVYYQEQIGDILFVQDGPNSIYAFNLKTNDCAKIVTTKNINEGIDITMGIPSENDDILHTDTPFLTVRQDNAYGLLAFDEAAMEFKVIVKSDVPIDEKRGFVVTVKNGEEIIRGTYFIHKLENIDRDSEDYIFSYSYGDGIHAIVKYTRGEWEDFYNIYNSKKQKMILKKPFKQVDVVEKTDETWVLKFNDSEKALFNFRYDKIVSSMYENIIPAQKENGFNMYFCYKGAQVDVLNMNGDFMKNFGMVISVSKEGKFFVTTSRNGYYIILNFDFTPLFDEEFLNIEEVSEHYFAPRKLSVKNFYKYLLLTKPDNTKFIYDIPQRKVVLSGIKEMSSMNYSDIAKFELVNGEKIMILAGYEGPDFTHKIAYDELVDGGSSRYFTTFIKGNKIYTYYWSSYDPKIVINGIDSASVASFRCSYENQFVIVLSSGSKMNFSVDEDGVFTVNSYSGNNQEQDINWLKQFQPINQIRESFNSMLKRINNVKF